MAATSGYLLAVPPSSAPAISLQTFLERSCSYEDEWPVPLNMQLRQHVLLGLASTLAVLPLCLLLLALLTPVAQAGFFWFGEGMALGMLELLLTPVAVVGTLLALVGYAALWYVSDGFEAAPWRWHLFAFGLALIGAVYVGWLGVPVLLVALNLATWVLVALVVAVIALVVCAVVLLCMIGAAVGGR